MRRSAQVVFIAVIVVVSAQAASAQAKDPFRPPGTSGSEIPGANAGREPGANPPAVPSSRDDGLARTGQDVGSPFAAGVALLAMGLAIRLIERAAGRSTGPRVRRFRPRTWVA